MTESQVRALTESGGLEPLVDDLFALYERATAADPRQYTLPSSARALQERVVEPLLALVQHALERVNELQARCDEGDGAGDLDLEVGDWGGHVEHTQTSADGEPVGRTLDERLWGHVADLCFTVRGELRRAERQLRGSYPAHQEQLIACESARRKIRRAMVALLEAAGRALGRAYPLASGQEAEIECAVAVRRMYARFRASLVPCPQAADAPGIRRALRFAAVSLAKMVGNGDFSEVRTSDRSMLLGLQARILSWAREGSSEAAGERLYQDITTAADLLRAINLRQELQAHDRQALREARLLLERELSSSGWGELVRVLSGLEGLDDQLDGLLAGALGGAAAAPLLPGIRRAVDELTGTSARLASA